VFVHEQLGSSVFMYDYRGYGQSEGQPSETGLYSDIDGAIQYVRSRGYDTQHIFLFGQSLGTAVTIDAASRQRVAGIILEAPFTSVAGVARKLVILPVGFILSNRFDSLAKVARVTVPVVAFDRRSRHTLQLRNAAI